tara:strand:+ start:14805 stop:15038 length:234 start_codon:yes stop_codon:yes gene_type:complete
MKSLPALQQIKAGSDFRKWKWEMSVQGVLIVIGGVFLAAMFFVLYIRAIAAERRAEELASELAELRAQSLLTKPNSE